MANKFKVNDLVVTHHEPEATVFRVVDVSGLMLGVKDGEYSTEYQDHTLFKTPTIGQLKKFNA